MRVVTRLSMGFKGCKGLGFIKGFGLKVKGLGFRVIKGVIMLLERIFWQGL